MKRLFLLALVAIISYSCASVEGEIENWAENQKKVEELAGKYPSFASLLKSEAERAAKVKAEADGISDADKKLEKLEEANDIIYSQMARDLSAIQGKIDNVNKEIDKAMSMKFPSSKINSVNRALEGGRKTIGEAEAIIAAGGTDLASVSQKLRDVTGDLITAAGNISRLTKKPKKKNS